MIRLTAFALLLLAGVFVGCDTATTSTPKPTIISFTASPASLPAGGGNVTLSWDVKDATTLSVDGGVGAVTGTSTTVSVTSNKTFTLTATNEVGSVTQSASVSVGTGADTTAPTVLSVDPANNAKGVRDDANIVITFSEEMDQAATQAAYQSTDLPASEVTFSWNAEGTVLTIQPNDFLEYAAGEDPSIEAVIYTFYVGAAKDVAGNSLIPFSSSFSTLKVIVISIYATATLDGDCYGSESCDTSSTTFLVGDLATAPTDSGYRSFVSFDLTSIPVGVVTDEARLIINKEGTNFNPDPYALGSMLLEHVNYGDSLSGEDYDTPVLADLGIYDSASAPATGYLASDVTSAVNDDLANRAVRGSRSQYRLRFPIENNDNNASDYVSFTSSEGPNGFRPFLNIVYYLP
jgi:hypothetical protein